MKIKKAVDICKRTGELTLCEGKDVQWITDGAAAYPMYAAPKFNAASDGITFMDAQYLRPLADADRDTFALYERRDTQGRIYFCAKSGMLLIGVIMPVQAINDKFCKQLTTLADRCRVALDNGRATLEWEDDGR